LILKRLKKQVVLKNLPKSVESTENHIANTSSFWGKCKLTLPFSAECLQISAFPSPTRWLYPLKPGGEQKSADVGWKTVTLIYRTPLCPYGFPLILGNFRGFSNENVSFSSFYFTVIK
jgi:hypothetical protein